MPFRFDDAEEASVPTTPNVHPASTDDLVRNKILDAKCWFCVFMQFWRVLYRTVKDLPKTLVFL
ncbi:MAG: hypothetical protein NVS3B14_07160 [Ktedonobacteraceae bacterium]